jgi:hypothetical protein
MTLLRQEEGRRECFSSPVGLVSETRLTKDYTDYLERMNTHTYEIVDAALRYPDVMVDVWGPGWKGYNRSVPLSENVRQRAWRIQQLEESKADWIRKRREREETAEKQRSRRERRQWWTWAEVARPPGMVETFDVEVLDDEEWEEPEWDVGGKGCSDVQWDVVWTISYVVTLVPIREVHQG